MKKYQRLAKERIQKEKKTPVKCEVCELEKPVGANFQSVFPICNKCRNNAEKAKQLLERIEEVENEHEEKTREEERLEENRSAWNEGRPRKIEVDGSSYWCVFPVKVGDVVELPPTGWQYSIGHYGTHKGKVTSLNGTYDGECKRVICLLESK